MSNPKTPVVQSSVPKPKTIELVSRNLAKRYRAEKRFRLYGVVSIGFGLLCLVMLFTDIIGKGYSAFLQTYIALDINFDTTLMDIDDLDDERQLNLANYDGLIKKALRERFPDVRNRREKRALYSLVSNGAGFMLQKQFRARPREYAGRTLKLWLPADDDVDVYIKHYHAKADNSAEDVPVAEAFKGRLSETQVGWIKALIADKAVEKRFNTLFFTAGDSREPELAGIHGAIMGSLFTLLVTLVLSFPIGVAAALYLEEYTQRSRLADFIEVNINNLAAVPSIIFGLLGLAIFINFFEMPRSIPLVGGIVLTLMTLPTIIISSRAAIKAVPPSIREAAFGIGASKMQVILHHVLPLAMPGMLTGAIIGMAQALGETAPLLMIGMVAFIVDVPGAVNDPATVLPVQIFLWSDSPERAFVERTSAAIMVLLGFLIIMNILAVWLRKRLERRW